MTATIHEADSFSLSVDVLQQPGGAPFNLTNAAVEAFAEGLDGSVIEATTEINSAPDGKIRVSFPAETFSEGAYTLQVRVDLGGEVQTVLSGYVINVLRSIGD